MNITKNLAVGIASFLSASAILLGCASSPPERASVGCLPAPETRPVPEPEARPVSISADALGLYRSKEDARKPPTDDELLVIASAKDLIGQLPNA